MATAEAGSVRINLAMNAGEFHRGVRDASSALDKLADHGRRLGAAFGGAFAFTQLTTFFVSAIRAAGEAETAIAGVNAVVKSTGGTAGFTASKLSGMAEELKKLSGIDDEVILRDLTANLLTFTNIVGPVFREAQVAALNLSVRLKQDLQSSAIQLGKALNDPIKGLTALRRVGVAFTESQKEQIKTMVQSGDIMGAQKIILAELAKEFGGQAEAVSKTLEGRLNKAVVAFGDALENVGRAIAPTILPLIEGVAGLAKSFSEVNPQLQTFGVVAGSTAVSLTALAAVAGLIAVAFGSISIPIAAAIAAISAAAGAIVAYKSEVMAAVSPIVNAFIAIGESVKKAVYDYIVPALQFADGIITSFISKLSITKAKVPLEGIGAEVKQNASELTDAIAQGGQNVIAANQAAADAIAKEAPALSEAQAMVNVQAAAKAEAAAQRQIEATKTAQAAQKKLAEEGLRLAEQIRTPTQIMVDDQKKLQAALEANKITAEQYGIAMQRATFVSANAYASMAASIGASLQQAFGKSKAVAIAVATINTFEAVTKALAAYPPPFNYVAAAAALAAGLAQVANIRKTTSSGSGASAGGGGGGGGALSGGSAPTTGSQVLTVRGLTSGTMMSGQLVRELAQKLLDYQRDGGRVVLQ